MNPIQLYIAVFKIILCVQLGKALNCQKCKSISSPTCVSNSITCGPSETYCYVFRLRTSPRLNSFLNTSAFIFQEYFSSTYVEKGCAVACVEGKIDLLDYILTSKCCKYNDCNGHFEQRNLLVFGILLAFTGIILLLFLSNSNVFIFIITKLKKKNIL